VLAGFFQFTLTPLARDAAAFSDDKLLLGVKRGDIGMARLEPALGLVFSFASLSHGTALRRGRGLRAALAAASSAA
jgi:hypothetical protein